MVVSKRPRQTMKCRAVELHQRLTAFQCAPTRLCPSFSTTINIGDLSTLHTGVLTCRMAFLLPQCKSNIVSILLSSSEQLDSDDDKNDLVLPKTYMHSSRRLSPFVCLLHAQIGSK